MEEIFFRQGWEGLAILGCAFVIIQLWKFYQMRQDAKAGDATRTSLILATKAQTEILTELVTILKAHDERAIDTQRRIIEMSAEGGVVDRLLDMIEQRVKV